MSKEIKIDKGVPLPKRYRAAMECPYPLSEMAVGDSFAIEVELNKVPTTRTRVAKWVRRLQNGDRPEFRTTSRFADGQLRVWRIADGKPKRVKDSADALPVAPATPPAIKKPTASVANSYVYRDGKKVPVSA